VNNRFRWHNKGMVLILICLMSMLTFRCAPSSLPAVASHVFQSTFLFSASVHSLLPLPFFASFTAGFAAPSFTTGLCNVPSESFAAFTFAALLGYFLASSSIRRCTSSCFLRKSSACIAPMLHDVSFMLTQGNSSAPSNLAANGCLHNAGSTATGCSTIPLNTPALPQQQAQYWR